MHNIHKWEYSLKASGPVMLEIERATVLESYYAELGSNV